MRNVCTGGVRWERLDGGVDVEGSPPALVAPAAYGLVKSDLAPEHQRTLILISKVLQNLSNTILFGEKEPFMMFMNPFINKNSRKMADCLQTLVKKASESAPAQNGTVETNAHARAPPHTHHTAQRSRSRGLCEQASSSRCRPGMRSSRTRP